MCTVILMQLWQVDMGPEGKAVVEFLSNLARHAKAVNVVRFSPNGELLASGGDGMLFHFYCVKVRFNFIHKLTAETIIVIRVITLNKAKTQINKNCKVELGKVKTHLSENKLKYVSL